MRHDALTAVGRTPLIRLQQLEPSNGAEIWIKLEGGNPTGSYKDRMALSVLSKAVERGEVSQGSQVVEYTGGSTGSALAFVSAVLGLEFTAIFSDAFADSKRLAMEAFGATVIVEPSENGQITPELIATMKARAYKMAEEPNTFYCDQFGSPDVRSGYQPMGREIADQLPGSVDVMVAAVGTGAALMGTLDGLKSAGHDPAVIALEPLQSPFLTTGIGGPHHVEGIGVGFQPPFLDLDTLEAVRTIDQQAAFEMSRKLASKLGVFGGGSTGMNVVAAVQLAKELGPGKRVVTLGCDTGSKYLGGHLFPGSRG